METIQIPEPAISRFMFADKRFAWVWLIVRLYVGFQWVTAGFEKIVSPAWWGVQGETVIEAFLNTVIAGAGKGGHVQVLSWYLWFIEHVALPHAAIFSWLVAYGELLVGIALLLGALTGIAAFFGVFMNFNYLFAGTIGINPLFILLQLFIILAWRNAGWFGIDRWLLPKLGVHWRPQKTA